MNNETAQVIETAHGSFILTRISLDLLKRIRDMLPYGVVGMQAADSDQIDYGLVMHCGDEEVMCIKLQPADCDRSQAEMSRQENAILITESLPGYMKHGFEGVLIPFPYMTDKGDDQYESGIALLIFPKPGGREAQSENPDDDGFDSRFGRGCNAMLEAFLRALQATSEETGTAMYQVIGTDSLPISHLGGLYLSYLLTGNQLVSLKALVSGQDATWALLRKVGIAEAAHMPSSLAGILPEQLPMAKPEAKR